MRLRRNNSSSGTIGLDIDGTYLAAAQVSAGRVEKAVSAPLEPGLVVDGEVVNDEGLAAALKDFVSTYDLPKDVRLGVGNQQIAVRHMELPRIEDAGERDTAVRFQAAEAMPMPMDDAVIDYSSLGEATSPEGAMLERLVIVAARRPMVSRFIEAARSAGLKPVGVDLDAFALVRVLGAADPGGAQPTRAYCHLGGVTNLAVARGPQCFFTRPLSARFNGLETDFAGLAEELRISIDYYLSQPGSEPVSEVLLSGPGAQEAEAVQRLGELLPMPVIAAQPLGTLGVSFPADQDPYRHTVSVGLAMGETA